MRLYASARAMRLPEQKSCWYNETVTDHPGNPRFPHTLFFLVLLYIDVYGWYCVDACDEMKTQQEKRRQCNA